MGNFRFLQHLERPVRGVDAATRPARGLAAVPEQSGIRRSAPDPWTNYQTRVISEAQEFMTTAYRARDVTVTSDPARFELTARYQHLELFSVDILHQAGHLEMVRADSARIYVAEVLQGRLHIETPNGRLSFGPGTRVLGAAEEPRRITCDDARLVIVGLETLALRRIAAELAGVDLLDVRFQPSWARTPERALQWSAAVRYVIQGMLDNPSVAASPLAQQEGFRLLATTALEVFPQDDLSLAEHGRTGAGRAPATIRRAVEFIEGHATEDISVEDIARVAGLSVRGTQAAFKRHLDTTPAAYLRRVRLAGAHHDLMAADPTKGTNVADIALRWGFVHQGHFAASYRQRYGVPPSHTLIH